jgi:hypothetical protein
MTLVITVFRKNFKIALSEIFCPLLQMKAGTDKIHLQVHSIKAALDFIA